jgi:hypothetical protein
MTVLGQSLRHPFSFQASTGLNLPFSKVLRHDLSEFPTSTLTPPVNLLAAPLLYPLKRSEPPKHIPRYVDHLWHINLLVEE